ncbi:MAG: nuclear transport factor 2 family protein [Bacteroidetes bacterium]|nr:nuclear transport factor 2 family protein [Bacteroidota bacterium]
MLKYFIPALVFMHLFSFPLLGQTIENQVDILRQNMLDPDISTLNKILASDLVYGHSNGKIEDKKAFIENLQNGNYDFTEITLKDQTIKTSKHIAIVRHTLYAKTNDKKVPAEVNLKILMVWKKEGKTWQLWERQAVKILVP